MTIRYKLQLFKDKKEENRLKSKNLMKRIMEVEAEDIPRRGETFTIESTSGLPKGYIDHYKAKVYEVDRKIKSNGDKDSKGVEKIYIQDIPLVKALIISQKTDYPKDSN